MKNIFAILLSVFVIQNANAWGPDGHMIVAQIAQDQLSPKAQQMIATLLPGKTLAQVSNWADSIKDKPEWIQTKPWHFVDIPDGQTYDTIPHDQAGDVITALTKMVNTLYAPTSAVTDKQNALMFIVHLMGDIHQPLHVGRPDDHGGNLIKVIFEGRGTNLHALWDSVLIQHQNMDYLQYAHALEAQSFMNETFDAPLVPFKDIVSEDMAVRKQIYELAGFTLAPIVVGQNYMDKNLRTMNSRLLLGGKRLADLLNKLFQ